MVGNFLLICCSYTQVDDLEQRLSQLDAEKTELAKYQSLDKTRRSLENAIFDKEISETALKLEQVFQKLGLACAYIPNKPVSMQLIQAKTCESPLHCSLFIEVCMGSIL